MEEALKQEVVGIVEERLVEFRKIVAGDIASAVSASEAAQDQKLAKFIESIRHSTDRMVIQSRRTNKSVQKMQSKLDRALQDRDQDYELLHREIFGDPDERSGNPSIHEALAEIRETSETWHEEVRANFNALDTRLAHIEVYERGAKVALRMISRIPIKSLFGFLGALIPWLIAALFSFIGIIDFLRPFGF